MSPNQNPFEHLETRDTEAYKSVLFKRKRGLSHLYSENNKGYDDRESWHFVHWDIRYIFAEHVKLRDQNPGCRFQLPVLNTLPSTLFPLQLCKLRN